MIRKTEAVALHVVPFSNTSEIVIWLTERYGKISTIAKGAHRPKSQFLGQYDLFYTCELLFYARERRGVQVMCECAPIETRPGFRSDWKAFSCASYFCDVAERCAPVGESNRKLYELLVMCLDFMAQRGVSLSFLFWAELRLMDTLGFAPQLRRCLGCRRQLDVPGQDRFFSAAGGGVLCSKCAADHRNAAHAVSADVLAILRNWQNAEEPQAAWNTKCTAAQLNEIRKILDLFLRYHLDIPAFSRNAALGMMEKQGR